MTAEDRTTTHTGAGGTAEVGEAAEPAVGPFAYPDATRADAGLATFSTWRVGTPERQRAAVDAIAATWRRLPWPTPELLGYSVYTGTDGETLLHYAQWTSEAAREAYVGAGRQAAHAAEIDAAVPGIERDGVTSYRLYRSAFTPRSRGPRAPAVGCAVAVSIEFDGPDEARLRRWVDGWFDGDEPEVDDFDGLLAAHFHVSTDGTRVLNYAEWVSVQAHVDALAAIHEDHQDNQEHQDHRDQQADDTDGDRDNDQWQNQLAFPGLKSTSFQRYHLSWTRTSPHPAPGPA
ncbi:antibiotic biosynthesis monooxygenase [Streptomyces sp. 71268]|uniref:antibiotic biosynthesis monooxygenase n=1 Tax=Streptomyces sp. 71268 TaxID=3002640 RepID=UPI0023F81176|nr:antibiotic biosynthesis monooxygenase [Streptomyces sp. 71268]WEV27212.1 antibiotic biosynthesis monooxygenase [Streptomyces sp. 71268]